jgi:phage tail-like protein
MVLSDTAQLGLAMRFEVVVDGVDLGGWATCEGLEVDFKPEAIEAGGINDYHPYLPGKVTYSQVTLSRAITASDSSKVMRWLSGKVRDFKGGTGEITLLDSGHKKVASWSLRNVYPSKWTGPTLDATSSKVAIEKLALVHEGFL